MSKLKNKIMIYTLMNFTIGLIFVPILILADLVVSYPTPIMICLTTTFFVIATYIIIATILMDVEVQRVGFDYAIRVKNDRLTSLDVSGAKEKKE